jgi:uncharacterized membrane protein YtjA (UPF0391 family)
MAEGAGVSPETRRRGMLLLLEKRMLNWAVIFLVFAIVAGIAGLTGIAGIASGVAQSLFLIFLVLFLAAMVARTFHDDPPDTGMG